MSGTDYLPVVDRMARYYYETFDSHFPEMSWERYKAEDWDGANSLYITPQSRALTHALPLVTQVQRDHVRSQVLQAELRVKGQFTRALQVAAEVLRVAGVELDE